LASARPEGEERREPASAREAGRGVRSGAADFPSPIIDAKDIHEQIEEGQTDACEKQPGGCARRADSTWRKPWTILVSINRGRESSSLFDFQRTGFNGPPDNAVATSISERHALTPRRGGRWRSPAVANLAGGRYSRRRPVAKTIGKGIIDSNLATERRCFAARNRSDSPGNLFHLVARGSTVSSSHAAGFGGLIGGPALGEVRGRVRRVAQRRHAQGLIGAVGSRRSRRGRDFPAPDRALVGFSNG